MMSLEACTACLQVLAAAGMPKQVYREELIDRLVGFIRFQLMHNVLVFHDAALCQAQRPELLSPGESCQAGPYMLGDSSLDSSVLGVLQPCTSCHVLC